MYNVTNGYYKASEFALFDIFPVHATVYAVLKIDILGTAQQW